MCCRCCHPARLAYGCLGDPDLGSHACQGSCTGLLVFVFSTLSPHTCCISSRCLCPLPPPPKCWGCRCELPSMADDLLLRCSAIFNRLFPSYAPRLPWSWCAQQERGEEQHSLSKPSLNVTDNLLCPHIGQNSSTFSVFISVEA